MRDCGRRRKKTSIRVDGSVPLCCVSYDPELTAAPSFLDLPHEEIQRRRYAHPFCKTCMEEGLHVDPGGVRDKLAETVARGPAPVARLALGLGLLERTRSGNG